MRELYSFNAHWWVRLWSVVILWLSLVLSASRGEEFRCHLGLPYTTLMTVHNEKCYQFVYQEKFWSEARTHCWNNGGRLAKIGDADTALFIKNTLNNALSHHWQNKGVWIGLHDRRREGTWDWVTKSSHGRESLGWSNWASGHPGATLHSFRDCVRMVRGSGWKWHETPCHMALWKYRFICEYDAYPYVPNADYSLDGFKKSSASSSRLPTTASSTRGRSTRFSKTGGLHLDKTSPSATGFYHVEVDPVHLARKEGEPVAKQNSVMHVALISCIAGLVLAVIVLLILYMRRRRRRKSSAEAPNKCVNAVYTSGKDCDGPPGEASSALIVADNNTAVSPSRAQNEYVVDVRIPTQYSLVVDNKEANRLSSAYMDPQCCCDNNVDNGVVENMKNCKHSKSQFYDKSKVNFYFPMDGSDDSGPYNLDDKMAHVYSEIPDDTEEWRAQNIYEDLDEVRAAAMATKA